MAGVRRPAGGGRAVGGLAAGGLGGSVSRWVVAGLRRDLVVLGLLCGRKSTTLRGVWSVAGVRRPARGGWAAGGLGGWVLRLGGCRAEA